MHCDSCKHSLLVALSCKRRGVCPSCGAKRAVKFAEHIYNEVNEYVPHRHTVFTIPKRLRVFFKYDSKLNTILLKAAWGALAQTLGIDASASWLQSSQCKRPVMPLTFIRIFTEY